MKCIVLFIDQIEKNSTHLQHSYFDSWNIFTILPGLDKISLGEGNASPYQTWVVFSVSPELLQYSGDKTTK